MIIQDGTDKFPTKEKAEEFAKAVRKKYFKGHEDSAQVFMSVFPPIVHVDRGTKESQIEVMVEKFGGVFAGT